MNAAEHDRNHELLCAWILGETSAEEAREVEQALAASPELRAERERLEQTIHLVQHSLSGEAQLSEESMASLLAAAAVPARGSGSETPIYQMSWYRHPALKVAAAVTVMLGGVLGILNIDGGSSPGTDTTVHVAGRPVEQNGFGRSSLGALDAPVSGDQSSASPASESQSSEAPLLSLAEVEVTFEEQAPAELDRRDLLAAKIQSDAETVPPLTVAPKDWKKEGELDVVGSVAAGKPDEQAAAEEVRTRQLERGVEVLDELMVGASEIAAVRAGERENAQLRLVQTEPAQAGDLDRKKIRGRRRDDGETTGSDDFFLGRGEKTETIDPQTMAELLDGSRRATQGAAGPSTSGPTTPGAPARSGGASKGLGYSATPATDSLFSSSSSRTRRRSNEALNPGAGGGSAKLGLESVTADTDAETGDVFYDYTYNKEGALVRSAELLDLDRTFGLESFRRAPLDQGRYRFQRKLTDEELRRLAAIYADRRFQDCRRRPEESPRDMYFRYWGDNPFEFTAKDPLSTFSVDVDTASYTLARRYLNDGHLPTREQIRTEEFLNYFDPDVPAPTEGTFAIQTELAPSLFGGRADRWMLRVAVRGKDVSKEERAPLALTFVIDTSGSMRENNRLELVKHAIRLLIGQLDARDSIAMVAYSTESRLILPMTSATQRDVIESALHPLQPSGSTNAEAGLKMGYAVAETALAPGVHSRVIFLSDGVANVGQTDQNRITADVARYRDAGVYLNTIGVGMNNHNDVFLEQLADKGDGICDYVDTPAAAQRAIVERFTGALIPIASDVKIQVQFDAGQVASYRLLGYENRAIADADFRNDKIDAGEVGAGHQVVALYELELISKEGAEEPLATVHLRWKAPKAARQHPLEVDVTEITKPVHFANAVDSFAAAGPGYRQSVLVAQFAEFLRRSTHARQDSFAKLEQEASKLAVELGDDDFHEFVAMVRKAVLLGLPLEHLRTSELSMTIEEYKRFLYLRAQLEELQGPRDRSGLQELRDANDSLEQKIRDLIHKDLESRNG